MIICINGKSIGSMTLPELQIELDVCGSEMLLVVSRFDIQETDSLRELTTLEDLAMDWSDIGAGAVLKTNKVSFEDDRSSGDICGKEIQMNGRIDELTKHVDSICNNAGTGPHPSLGSCKQADIPKCHPVPAYESVITCDDKTTKAPKKKYLKHNLTEQDLVNGAALGCKKCKRQLETGVKHKDWHCKSCPNKYKQQGTITIVKKSSHDEIESHCSSWKGSKGPSSGIGGSAKATTTASTTKKKPVSRYQKQLEELSDDGSDASSGDECDAFDDDENPWLGCVCGKSHPKPIKVFWIQCESCDAWYNVAEECVGFNEEAAGTIGKWCCWACNPPVAGLGL
jgi:hypothetical protein